MTAPAPRRYTAEELYYAAEHARPLKWQDAAGEHEIDLEELLYSAAEDASRLEQIAKEERDRIVMFLADVFHNSTHGASSLFERAIDAVQRNDMSDPVRIAQPQYAAGRREETEGR